MGSQVNQIQMTIQLTPTPSNPQHNPERPNPTKGTRPPPQGTGRDSERGEGDLGELERETGGQGWVWRLTDRGLGREEREKRGVWGWF